MGKHCRCNSGRCGNAANSWISDNRHLNSCRRNCTAHSANCWNFGWPQSWHATACQPACCPNELAAIRLGVREFLADQTAALESARQRQRQELQTLAASLTQQQEALAIRHEALQRWAHERQQESDDQAAHLELREQELEQLHQQLLRDKQAWLIALDEEFANAIKKASCL